MKAKRRDSFVHEWFDLVDKSGLVLSEPTLHVHFPGGPEPLPRRAGRALLGNRERFEVDPTDAGRRARWNEAVLFDLLGWPRDRYRSRQELEEDLWVRPDEVEETLRPAGVLRDAGGRVLIGWWTVPASQGLDRVERRYGRWRATPQAKLERWMRGAAVPLALLSNGRHFRLVHVPPGLPAAYLDFEASLWADEKAVLDGFVTLLSAERFFGPEKTRLERLVAESQERQAELTDTLGLQVRAAVEQLILALDAADHARGGKLLAGVSEDGLYRAAVYAVMRLVFLLFAEERNLLPHGNVFYDEGYGLGRLLHSLGEERRQLEETFRRGEDAWPQLLALFRLVFLGGRHPDLNLPAYGGDLFDPAGFEAMRVLEHPELRIRNAAVYDILRALTFGEAKVGREKISQRYSYRILDVEHIGYLYEGLLDHRAARAGAEPMVKLRNGTEQAHRLTVLEERSGEDLEEFLAKEKVFAGNRDRIRRYLDEPLAGDLGALRRLKSAVAERCRPYAGVIQVEEIVEPHRFYLTTSTSRRATGTHYTPIQYTRAMVQETLDPLVHVGEHGKMEQPLRVRSPRELLELKVCDPAMGSGAFLVQAIRYLGGKLVDAWWAERERVGEEMALYLPYAENGEARAERIPVPSEREEAEVWARRLVAERCIYGVDKNPLAVEMAKLSLWLVTLSRDKPFSFLDHALKSGDSLLGLSSLDQLRTWSLDGKGEFVHFSALPVNDAVDLRKEIQKLPAATPEDVVEKGRLHAEAEARVEGLKALANLLLSTVIAEEKPARQAELQARLLESVGDRLEEPDAISVLARRRLGEHRPFHWALEFPEVFERDRAGFNAFVGNPPFMGGQKLTGAFGKAYREYLVEQLADGVRGSVDLVAYFFLRAFRLLCRDGNFGLLAINTIAEGDTRKVGIERLLKMNGVVYAAHPNEPWPNQAAVVTSRVHLHKGQWLGDQHLSGRPAPRISAFLSDREEWTPERLSANTNIAFQGSIPLGKGFIIEEADALAMIHLDPKNSEIIFPFLNGRDLNSHPEQQAGRWIINFWDWPKERAKEFVKPFSVVEEKVKPQRLKVKRKLRRERWWRFAEPTPALYHAIGRGHRFIRHPTGWQEDSRPQEKILTCSEVTKFLAFSFVDNSAIVSANADVFVSEDFGLFAVLQSWLHAVWAWKQSSKLETRLKYSPGNAFETFPLPRESNPQSVWRTTPALGQEYHDARGKIMTDAEIGLTDLYNRFHNPVDDTNDFDHLRDIQVQMDQTVARAYGWDDLDLGHDFHEVPYLPENDRIRFTVSEPARLEILDRLSQLNRERYEEEVAEGLHDKKKRKPARKRKKPSAAPAEPAPLLPFAPREPSEPYPTHDQREVLLEVAEPAAEYKLFPEDEPAAPASQPPPDSKGTPADRIRSWLDTHPGWHARGEILAEVKLSTPDWNAAIRELVEFGEVERKGQKRGTRYRRRADDA